jgi:hypothetical protein
MAKKSRRSRSKRASKRAARKVTTPAAMERSAKGLGTQVEATGAQGLAEQYTYVYDDLKRIAVLAGTLLALLVGLSFVIG